MEDDHCGSFSTVQEGLRGVGQAVASVEMKIDERHALLRRRAVKIRLGEDSATVTCDLSRSLSFAYAPLPFLINRKGKKAMCYDQGPFITETLYTRPVDVSLRD